MLERLRLILNVKDQDELLTEILTLVVEKLTTYLGEPSVPTQFEWIIAEMAVQRFNRIGSEGISTESVDGKQNTYIDDELTPFYQFLDDYKASKNGNINVKGYKLF